jgi:hypothetical protein
MDLGMNNWVGRWTHFHSWEEVELDGLDDPLCLRSLASLLLWKTCLR